MRLSTLGKRSSVVSSGFRAALRASLCASTFPGTDSPFKFGVLWNVNGTSGKFV